MRGWRALGTGVMLVAYLFGAGCGGVFEEVSPPEKRRVLVIVNPDFVRVGESEVQVGAFIEVPLDGTFVTAIEMQDGIGVIGYDTRDNRGCPGMADPVEFADVEPYRLCVTIEVTESAEIGERSAVFELRVGNEPVMAETTFMVWRALPQ